MKHSVLELSASPKQISKLRNGHKVRVKPAMEGMGMCVIVDPLKYSIVSRTFSRGKGAELQLSPEELQMNKSNPMGGKGLYAGGDIFDKIADKVADKAIDKGLEFLEKKASGKGMTGCSLTEKLVDKVADKAIDKGINILEKRISGMGMKKGSPEMKKKMADLRARKGKKMTGGAFTNEDVRPVMAEVGKYLNPLELVNFMDGKGLENSNPLLLGYDLGHNVIGPALYKSIYGHPRGYGMKPDADTIHKLNQELGTNMGYLMNSGIGNAVSDIMSSSLIGDAVQASKNMTQSRLGMGLYAGAERGRGMSSSCCGRAVRGQVGIMGNKVLPDALQSKPLSANFQFQHTLPPAYQKFSKSAM